MTTKKTYKEEIIDLLNKAEQCQSDPEKCEQIFGEINRRLRFFYKDRETFRHRFDDFGSREGYLSERIKTLYELEDYENCLKCYQELYELLPEHPKVLKGLGDCYRKLGKHEDAIKQYDQALKIIGFDEDIPSLQAIILNNKALSLIEQKQFGNAVVALKVAISIDEYNPLYFITLGRLYNREGKDKEALESFTEAFDLLHSSDLQLNPVNAKYFKAILPHVIALMKLKENLGPVKKEGMKKIKEESEVRTEEIKKLVDEVLSLNARRRTIDMIITKYGISSTTDWDVLGELTVQQIERLEDFKKEILECIPQLAEEGRAAQRQFEKEPQKLDTFYH